MSLYECLQVFTSLQDDIPELQEVFIVKIMSAVLLTSLDTLGMYVSGFLEYLRHYIHHQQSDIIHRNNVLGVFLRKISMQS